MKSFNVYVGNEVHKIKADSFVKSEDGLAFYRETPGPMEGVKHVELCAHVGVPAIVIEYRDDTDARPAEQPWVEIDRSAPGDANSRWELDYPTRPLVRIDKDGPKIERHWWDDPEYQKRAAALERARDNGMPD